MFIIPDEWEFITANNESGKYLFTKLEISLMPSNTSIFDMILKNISIIHIIYTTLLNLLKNIIVRIISTNIIIKSIKITPSVIITYFIFFNLYKIIILYFFTKKINSHYESYILMASPERFERPTDPLEGDCSIQLSYEDISSEQ